MRRQYERQLELLHTGLIRMGALCEDAIAGATQALVHSSAAEGAAQQGRTDSLEHDINLMERELEQMCVRLLLHQQPMASDLRRITAAQRMIVDMERIGDQAADIAELARFMKNSPVKSDIHIVDMARATISMVTDSIDSYVTENPVQARAVVAYDDVVDDLFCEVKSELIATLLSDSSLASECLDLLMIAKYFERIGDHAVNIAEWVLYSITGNRDAQVQGEE